MTKQHSAVRIVVAADDLPAIVAALAAAGIAVEVAVDPACEAEHSRSQTSAPSRCGRCRRETVDGARRCADCRARDAQRRAVGAQRAAQSGAVAQSAQAQSRAVAQPTAQLRAPRSVLSTVPSPSSSNPAGDADDAVAAQSAFKRARELRAEAARRAELRAADAQSCAVAQSAGGAQ